MSNAKNHRAASVLLVDMDGVLADTEPLQAEAWVRLLERYGITTEASCFDGWIGIANAQTACQVKSRWQLRPSPEQLLAEREPVYFDLVRTSLTPFPGVKERLRELRSIPMAVATSASRLEATLVLRALGMDDAFGAVVTADDVSRTKPDPEPYLHAAAALGRDPGACAVIEDSPAGVAAARAAGCYVLALTTTHRAATLHEAHEIHASTVSALDAAFPRGA